jgi:uncharacterized membrane protein (DUF106 family)
MAQPQTKQPPQKRPPAPPIPKGQSYMLVMMMLMLLIMTTPNLSSGLGSAMGVVLTPAIGFGGHMPVLSILCAGLITGMLSTILRHWTTDYVAIARGQVLNKSFSKEMMDARAKGDVDRVERLRRAQPFMMSHTMSAQYATMKPAIGTMIVALAVYGWMNHFLSTSVPTRNVSLPWTVYWALPAGSIQMMFLYAIVSLPVTLVATNALKLHRFRNFDPKAELPPIPTVNDLIRRAQGEIDDETVVKKEGEKAKRRLRAASGIVEDDEDAEVVHEDDEDIEIVDPDEEGEGADAESGQGGVTVARLADEAEGDDPAREEE